MPKGGFKVLINGRVERLNKFSVDFDKRKFIRNSPEGEVEETFDPTCFAVMTVTSEDMDIKPENKVCRKCACEGEECKCGVDLKVFNE